MYCWYGFFGIKIALMILRDLKALTGWTIFGIYRMMGEGNVSWGRVLR